MVRFLKWTIRCYQRIGGFFPQACCFHPSCSVYALEALERYGAFRGGLKIIKRIARCSPLSAGGFDPLE